MHDRKISTLFYSLLLSSTCGIAFAIPNAITTNKTSFHLSGLYLQPGSDNLKYAVFVSGHQPFQQSWQYQEIKPGYSPGFELGLRYPFPQSEYNASIDWLYFDSNDSNSKQASERVDLSNVQFVAPPYDVGPAVFGIKRANSTVNFNFNSIQFNIGKMLEYCPLIQVRIFGGLNALRLKQNIKTTFSDYAGSPPIPTQAYALPSDPSFYFITKNTSTYTGIGPDLGINVKYEIMNGFGIGGQFLGTITAGSIHAKDNFTSSSSRLKTLGINPSHQFISTPDTTQVVPGVDSNLSVFYTHAWNCFDLTIEAGYRFAYYHNAISEVIPQTLVQAGENETIPEFATGTMAIQSTDYKHSPFSLQGPYLELTLNLA